MHKKFLNNKLNCFQTNNYSHYNISINYCQPFLSNLLTESKKHEKHKMLFYL